MSLLDRLLPWRAFAAGRASAQSTAEFRERLQRLRSREAVMSAARHFLSATEDRRRPNWWSQSMSADSELLSNLPIIRARCRLLADNDGKIKGIIHKELTNTIGPGPSVQASLPDELLRRLNFSDEQQEFYADRAEAFWRERVVSAPVPANLDFDARRQRTWLQLTRLRLRHYKVDGAVFVRYRFVQGRSLPFCAQIVEPECVATPPALARSGNVRAGLQFSEEGEFEGAWVSNRHPFDISAAGALRYDFIPVRNDLGLPQLVYLFDPHRESASRELPWLNAALLPANDAADYKQSELERKCIEASVAVYLTLQNPDDWKAAAEADTGFGQTDDASVEKRTSAETLWPRNQVFSLKQNEDVKVISADRPGSNYEPFMDSIDRDIGNAIGRSFERVANNYGAANFSATRVSGIEDKIEHDTDFKLFAESILAADWAWAMFALAIEAGSPIYRALRGNFARFVKPSWDPEVDATAATERIENQTSSVVEESAAIGHDYETVQKNAVKARRRLRDAEAEAKLDPKPPRAPKPVIKMEAPKNA